MNVAHEFRSSAEAHFARLTAFYKQMRATCTCRCLELRQEGWLLHCARCHAPIVPKEATS